MPKHTRLAVLAALGMLLTLLTPAAQAYPCGRPSGCAGFELVSAGASYGWYPVKHRYEFIGHTPPKEWKLGGRGKLAQRSSMLTLIARRGVQSHPVTSTWTGKSFYYETGRWETPGCGWTRSPPRATRTTYRSRSHRRYYCGAQDIHILN